MKIISKIITNPSLSGFINGTLWNLAGAFFSRGILFFVSIFSARILDIETFGKLGIIRSTVNTYVLFASFGLGITATKYVSEFIGKDNERVRSIITITKWFAFLTSGITFLLFFIFAEKISRDFLNAPEMIFELKIASFILILVALNGVYNGIIIGFKNFKAVATNNIIGGVLSLPIQIFLIWSLGLFGAVLGLCLYYTLLLTLNIYTTNKLTSGFQKTKKKLSDLKSELSVIWNFSLPVFLTNLLVTPIMWIGSVFLVNQSNGYYENAIFEGAKQINQLVVFIPFIISQITLPMLSSEKNNTINFNKILKVNLIVVGLVTIAIAIILSIFSSYIMQVYGQAYSDGNFTLILLVFSAVFMGLTNILGKAFASKNKMWRNFSLSLLWATEFIICAFIFLKLYPMGAIGLALSYLIAYFLHFIQSGMLLRTQIK